MFRKLHIRLTVFCTLVCGTILVLMSFICLFFSETETTERHFSDFQINVNMLLNHLETQTVISYNWLAQANADTQFEIDIRDNGSKLIFEELSPLSLDEGLFAAAREKAREEHMIFEETIRQGSKLSAHAEFELSQSKEAYYAAVALIPKSNGVLNIAVLHPLDDLEQSLRTTRLLFAWADLLGVLLLSVFFWFFTWRMIQPLIDSRRKQTEFIAAASHELRSPLTVMLSCLFAMKHASPPEAEQFAQNIALEGKRMGRLIEDMLTLTATDSSHFTIQKTDVELDTLLLSVYEKFEPQAHTKQISLRLSLPDGLLPHCTCDKERIEQVLSILLDNALCYTPKGGVICLSLAATPKKFTIRIADNGIGVPDSEKKAIFDRFYRCEKSHKDKTHFGLGLCIAKEIVHMHKGKLWVEDTPGGGATFVTVLYAT